MNKVYIFDVDGTLTPSRRQMMGEFKKYFVEWSKKNFFFLVTGSDIEKLDEQVPHEVLMYSQAIFTCAGNEMWVFDKDNTSSFRRNGSSFPFTRVYKNEFNPPQELIEYLEEKLKSSKYHHRAGNHIEDRGSMLNFSIVGRNCSLMERENYFKWDIKEGERKEISRAIGFRWPELEAVIGGQISIDIYPKGKDKSQILFYINKILNRKLSSTGIKGHSYYGIQYNFIGDRIHEGGNDYPLAEALSKNNYSKSHQTEGPEHTQQILEKLSD